MYTDTYPYRFAPVTPKSEGEQNPEDLQKAAKLMQQAFAALLEYGEPMLSQDEACSALQCGPVRLHNLLASGQLPGLKMGKHWVLPRRAFFERVNALSLSEALERWRASNPDPLLDAMAVDPRLIQVRETIRLKQRGPGRPRKP